MPEQQSCSYNPRHAQWNDVPIDQWEAAKWKQWKPKSPTSDHNAKIEREYLRIKHAINQANLALSLDKVKIKLKLTSAKSIALVFLKLLYLYHHTSVRKMWFYRNNGNGYMGCWLLTV